MLIAVSSMEFYYHHSRSKNLDLSFRRPSVLSLDNMTLLGRVLWELSLNKDQYSLHNPVLTTETL